MGKTVIYPNLVSEMARNGETQKDLAKILNIDQGAICRRLKGVTKFTAEEVVLICEHYKKSYYELFR